MDCGAFLVTKKGRMMTSSSQFGRGGVCGAFRRVGGVEGDVQAYGNDDDRKHAREAGQQEI